MTTTTPLPEREQQARMTAAEKRGYRRGVRDAAELSKAHDARGDTAKGILKLIAFVSQPRPTSAPVVGERWQDIASAPKDGTVIDVWRDGDRETVYWGLPPHDCGEMGQYCDSDWHSIKKPGWICSTFGEFVGGKHDPFTHWMPLPAAPAEGALAREQAASPPPVEGEDAPDFRMNLARALFEASYQMRLIAWSDETRDFWLDRADALATPKATASPPSEVLEVLRPFAQHADFYDSCDQHPNGCPDDALAGEVPDLTVGDFRRARALIAEHDATKGGRDD